MLWMSVVSQTSGHRLKTQNSNAQHVETHAQAHDHTQPYSTHVAELNLQAVPCCSELGRQRQCGSAEDRQHAPPPLVRVRVCTYRSAAASQVIDRGRAQIQSTHPHTRFHTHPRSHDPIPITLLPYRDWRATAAGATAVPPSWAPPLLMRLPGCCGAGLQVEGQLYHHCTSLPAPSCRARRDPHPSFLVTRGWGWVWPRFRSARDLLMRRPGYSTYRHVLTAARSY